MTTEQPRLRARQRPRIVLCMGRYCNQNGQAEPLEALLQQKLGERKPSFRLKLDEIAWEIANCVSMCGAGPNVIVYPNNIHYHHVDESTLLRIVEQLLTENRAINHQE